MASSKLKSEALEALAVGVALICADFARIALPLCRDNSQNRDEKPPSCRCSTVDPHNSTRAVFKIRTRVLESQRLNCQVRSCSSVPSKQQKVSTYMPCGWVHRWYVPAVLWPSTQQLLDICILKKKMHKLFMYISALLY